MARFTYTISEVAQLLGMSLNATYDAARRAEIPGVIRIGSRILVSRFELDRMLGRHTLDITNATGPNGGLREGSEQ